MKILIGIEIVSFIYTLLLLVMYFSKKRVSNLDVKITMFMLIDTLLGLGIEILMNYCGLKLYKTNQDLCIKICCIYVIHYIISLAILIFYNVGKLFSYNTEDKDILKKRLKILGMVLAGLALVSSVSIFLLKGEAINDGEWFYGTGPDIYIVFAWSIILIILTLINLFANFKKSTKREKVSAFAIVLMLTISGLFRILIPYFTINNTIISILSFILYFTIENSDMITISQLTNANSVKQDFLSSMSHELKTPLNIILGLSNTPGTDLITLQNDMKNINVEALALTEIFGNIIDVNMLESGKVDIIEKEYNIKEVLTTLINEYNRRLSSKGIELKCYCDSMIPKRLIGDYEKIISATRKLMSNAAKFTERGTITVNIGGEIKKDIYNLKIEVKDTGKGIEKESFDKIFAEFGKQSSDVNSATSGIGLGLTICKTLVYAMGGKILMGSEPGIGSTFVIEIPQKIAGTVTVEQQLNKREPAQGDSEEGTATVAAKLTALIVDDNALNIKVGKKLLENQGIEVTEASSADECLRILNEGKKFNYIFMDIMMPVKDGVICMHEIRYLDLPYVPIIVALTADSAMGSKERYLKEGFDDYIAKPLTPEELNRVLKKAK